MTSHRPEETLDPQNWTEVSNLAHQMIDNAVAYTKDVRGRPVWQAMPAQLVDGFQSPLPNEPTALGDLMGELEENMMPYAMGNTHPRFWMWFMGASNFTGAMADFMAAVLGSNLGGGNHAAAAIDQQVVDWCKEIVGFAKDSSGTLVSGGSMANLIGLTVARNEAARKGPTGCGADGVDLRRDGIGALSKPLRFYGSDQLHICHSSALESLGLGSRALVQIPTDASCRLDMTALAAQVEADRLGGFQPAAVIASAGTVNTGAVDDLSAIADYCHEQGLWFHVDGCIGALVALAPRHRHLVAGLSRADSIALDPHKWLHAPFDVGCALVRDRQAHLNAFAQNPEYLKAADRGIANAPWLNDYSVHTTRGFRALKVWLALKEHGADKFGRLIDQNIDQATYLAQKISDNAELELLFKGSLNIICFRFRPARKTMEPEALAHLNREILYRLQETGRAALSDTTVHGQYCLRAAICNHRTIYDDLDFLVEELILTGNEVLGL